MDMSNDIKRNIILFTSRLIIRDGIHAVRMDDIAKGMNISKRTIYKLFFNKNELVHACIEREISLLEKRKEVLARMDRNPLEKLFDLASQYIEDLHRKQTVFWSDITGMFEYRHIYMKYRTFWKLVFENQVRRCQEGGYVVDYIDVKIFVAVLISTLYNGRISNCHLKFQQTVAYLLIKGMATTDGDVRLRTVKDRISCENETERFYFKT